MRDGGIFKRLYPGDTKSDLKKNTTVITVWVTTKRNMPFDRARRIA